MANEPVKTWQETFGRVASDSVLATGRGLWRAGELGYAAASQVGGVAMSGGVAGAGYLASGTASGVNTVYKAAEAHPKTAAAIGGGTLAVVAAPVALAAAGFSSAGVAAGSAAAAWQATIGNVAAGSTFAALQGAGAAGMAASTTAAVGAAGAAGGTALCSAARQIGK